MTKVRTMAAVATLALAVGACASGDSTGSGGGSGEGVTKAQLEAALLAETDLPSGFTKTPQSPDQDDQDDDLCDVALSAEAQTTVSAEFQQSDFGPFVTQELEVYAAGDAKKVFDEFLSVLDTCRTWETDFEGQSIAFDVLRGPAVNLGDQSASVQLAFEASGFSLFVDAIVFRRGDVVSFIAVVGIGGAAGKGLAEPIATKADAKIKATIG